MSVTSGLTLSTTTAANGERHEPLKLRARTMHLKAFEVAYALFATPSNAYCGVSDAGSLPSIVYRALVPVSVTTLEMLRLPNKSPQLAKPLEA